MSSKPSRKKSATPLDNSPETPERNSPRVEAEEQKDRLDPADLHLLELLNTRAAWEQSKAALASVRAQLLEHRSALEIRALKQAAEEHDRQAKKHRREATALIAELTEKHGLTGKSWGYDDYTGTITVEEPKKRDETDGDRTRQGG